MIKTILFELNEVPWKVMDWFCEQNPRSAFAQVRAEGRGYETIAEDSGELHPWVTWPSLHRGVNNDRHGIQHLGQDLRDADTGYPAIWRILADAGLTVGVVGSLQTFPVPQQNGNYSFYIPDTYAPGADTIPAHLADFQSANLRLTKENSRNVAGRTSVDVAIQLAGSLPKAGMRLGTAMQIGLQLLREKTDKTKLNRRRAIQSALYFDAFLKQLQGRQPAFCTFFTNHVAAAMHRFWAATFRDDYGAFTLPEQWVSAYSDEIRWAMNLADAFAARLIQFCRLHPEYRLVVCSSMGQAATTASVREGIYVIKNLPLFFAALGVEPDEVRPAMTMAPDISVHLLADRAVTKVRNALPILHAAFEGMDADIDERNLLHLRIVVEPDPEKPLPRLMIGNVEYSLQEAGFEFVEDQDRVGTTAYHVPEGILMNWGSKSATRISRATRRAVGSLSVAPAIIASYGLTPPSYMKRPELTL